MFLECEDDTPIEVSRVDAGADKATVTASINDNFNKIVKAVVDLRKRGSDVNLDEINRSIAEIKEAQRKQDEALVNRGGSHAGAGDNELRRFVGSDGKILLRGSNGADGWRPGLLDDDAESVNDWHRETRRLVSLRSIAKMALPLGGARSPETPKLDAMLARHLDLAPDTIRRTFSGATGLGAEWAQTLVVPSVVEALRLPAMAVEDLFDVMPMAAGTLTLPVSTTLPRAYRYGRPGTPAAQYAGSDVGTDSRTMTAQGLAVMVPVWDDASEDSVIDAGAFIMANMITGLRLSTVDAIVNGDSNATHQDTALASWNPGSIFDANGTYGGSDDPRRAWLGLRADAFDTSTTRDASGDSTFTGSGGTLPTALAALKAPHGAVGDLVYLTSFNHFIAKIATDSNLLTVDKYGPNATILKGESGAIYGKVKVVISELVTSDLQATGLFTTTGGSYSSGLLFNRKRWIMGVRRGVTSEIERRASEGVNYLVVTRRVIFKKLDATADKTVHLSYKV